MPDALVMLLAQGSGLTGDAWILAGVLVVMVGGLISGRFGADLVLLGGLGVLLLTGVLTPSQAVTGFAQPAVVTIAVLYVVAAGLKETGAMTGLTAMLLGKPSSLWGAQLRLSAPVAVASALVNNTPIVAMFLPVLSDWAKQHNLSISRLFMPLSFAAILGGMCTLLGTSTNLLVHGLVLDHADEPGVEPMGMFTIAWVGVPAAILGIAYIAVAGRFLLPNRDERTFDLSNPRQYTTAMRVDSEAGIVGQTVDQAGLRRLAGLFLARIEREEETLHAVAPTQVLRAGDRLVFVGVLDSVRDLQKIKGLSPVPGDEREELVGPRHASRLIEAVVSQGSPLLGMSIRQASLRTRYGAVVIAAHRQGERIDGRLGDVRLRAGDTLLLETSGDFTERYRNSQDFYLVNELPGAAAPRHARAPLALAVLVGMVALITYDPDRAMAYALAAALGMVLLRCCTGPDARRSVDWQVLTVVGSAFGFATAMEQTGLASVLAGSLVDWGSTLGVWGLLAVVYALTAFFTSIITNNAAAILMFPVALEAARDNDLPLLPFAVCVAVAASAGFATPMGYQTNMMVMGPGGYRMSDFLRFGLPLTILVGAVTVGLAPLVYISA